MELFKKSRRFLFRLLFVYVHTVTKNRQSLFSCYDCSCLAFLSILYFVLGMYDIFIQYVPNISVMM